MLYSMNVFNIDELITMQLILFVPFTWEIHMMKFTGQCPHKDYRVNPA